MNLFDIVVGVILIIGVVKGFRNGFIKEIALILALVLGVFGAIKFSSFTESILQEHMQSEYIGVISFLVTFIIIVILVHLLSNLLKTLINAVALGTVNRLTGAAFALFKYAFILSVLLSIYKGFDSNYSSLPDSVKNESFLFKPLNSLAPSIFPYLNFNWIDEFVSEGNDLIDKF